MNGWICLWRKIQQWEWWLGNSDILKVFIYLLCNANTKDREWKGRSMVIKRGQLVTSRQTIALGTGLTERSVRTCLEHLKESADIDIKTTNKFSIISICNYDTYQQQKEENRQQNDQQTASKTTSKPPAKRPTNDQQSVHANNNIIIEQVINNKEKNNSFCEDKSSLPDSNFAAEPPSAEPTFEEEVVPLSKEDFNFSGKSNVQVVEPELFAAPETVKNDNTANETSTAVQVYGTTETMPQMPKNTPKTTNTATPVAVQTAIPELTLRYDDIIAWFNKQVAMCAIPPVRVLNAKRKTNFRNCLKEFGRDKINQAVQMASRSKFLNGNNDRGFVADFDFIFNPNKLPRIIEGFYDREKADPAKVVVQKLANAGTMENYLAGNPLFDKNYFKNLNARKNGQQQQ